MPDLEDGESIQVHGSARLPYTLKNVGGVYSCSCPAWRNQSLPIERRSCKHLRQFRGEQAEHARLEGFRAVATLSPPKDATVPRLLLAESWDCHTDVAGWWMSEKCDGVRAWWDGSRLLSRQGNVYHAPDWFTANLPPVALDGELWLDRKAFQQTVSIVRRHDRSEHWRRIRYVLFDVPGVDGPFEERQKAIFELLRQHQPEYATLLDQVCCTGIPNLRAELARIESLGGEGVMLRQPGSRYEAGRSPTLLKVKTFRDAEGRVVEHLPGKGRHTGRLGAMVVAMPSGLTFSLGTGLSDAQRASPPPVGSIVTYRYQELTQRGVPRFPSLVRVRNDSGPLLLGSPAPDN